MPKLTQWNPSSNSWFLGIGIDSYQNFDGLSNAVKGVKEVKDVLLDHYDLDEECVVTLFDKKATKENIIDTLDELGGKIKPEDKLLIYYSGHGHLNNTLGLGYWIPIDAKKGKASSYLPNSTIRDYVKGIKAKHILLISDSCFSGSLFMQGAYRTSRAVQELDSLNSRWAICSGRHDEEVYDGTPGENSPFTQSFIDYLKKNEKESVNVGRVADHVIEQTAANYEQLPDGRPMFGVGHQGGQYIFWKKDSISPSQAAVQRTERSEKSESDIKVPDTPEKKTLPISKISVGLAVLAIGLIIGFTQLDRSDPMDVSSTPLSLVDPILNESIESESNSSQKISDQIKKNSTISDKKSKESLGTVSEVNKKKVATPVLINDVNDAVIELYELPNYKGRMFPIYGEQSSKIDNFNDIEIKGLKFNDVISSVTLAIPSDYEFILYENKKQKGQKIAFSGNGMKKEYPTLGALMGKVSSCELRKK